MKFDIWVDSDSVPKNLRTIILKAAVRINTAAYFVADRQLPDVKQFIADDTHRVRAESGDISLKSKIKMIVVQSGENSADDYIVQNALPGSLCITHDIPLASRLLETGCTVLDDRGGQYTQDDIQSRLSDRAVNAELRFWGVFAVAQKKQKPSDVKAFADLFDCIINRLLKS